MMTIDMPRKDKPYAELHVDGKLRAEDYDAMIPKLEQAIAEQGKLRCLVALDDFAGFTPSALADELKFDVRHHDDFERCAIVGDSKLEEITYDTEVEDEFLMLKAEVSGLLPEETGGGSKVGKPEAED